jgi:predicted transcriptional regulator
MMISQSDLDNFHLFATNEIARVGREVSLEELVSQWRARQVDLDTVESVRRGMADAEAGRTQTLSNVDARIRTELGFPARRQ